jgi:hypothetical protein
MRREISPFVRETLERAAVGLWFTGVLILLYMTLQSQLARGNEPEPEWDLVALYGGTVDVDASGAVATESGTMRHPIRGEMPILLSLPLRFARRPQRRRRRARGALIWLVAAAVIALLMSI